MLVSDLEGLAGLFRSGDLTAHEYSQAKARLLPASALATTSSSSAGTAAAATVAAVAVVAASANVGTPTSEDSPLAPTPRTARPAWQGGYQLRTPDTPGWGGSIMMEKLGEAMAEDGRALPFAANLTHTCDEPPNGQSRGVGGWSFDCDRTLTDSQVLEFCRSGVLIIPGAVPAETNLLCLEYLEGRLPSQPIGIPEGMTAVSVHTCGNHYVR